MGRGGEEVGIMLRGGVREVGMGQGGVRWWVKDRSEVGSEGRSGMRWGHVRRSRE